MAVTVAQIFKADLAANPSRVSEFPVTTMSTDLAHAITSLPATSGDSFVSALDVGTGSGLHAAAMAVAGCRDILAIDISSHAIAAAAERFQRIRAQLDRLAGFAVAQPKYLTCDMVDLPASRQFDLIAANPPSFFLPQDGKPADLPMVHALFDGKRSSAGKPEESFLYRFLDRVVGPTLRPNGLMLCGWPAIERRVADSLDGGLVHPARRLEEWLGWTVTTEQRDAESFFCRAAGVSGYGRDDGLLQQVANDVRNDAIYSTSLDFPDPTTMRFRFGILGLRRDPGSGHKFRAVEVRF
jgi:predicted RNA methylase